MPDTAQAPDFVPTARTKVKRLYQRAHYDRKTVYEILDALLVCHVAYVIDGQPYVTPTAFWREDDWVYWHGSSASRMLRTTEGGIPVSLSVDQLDGLVLARSAFHHSMNYRSVVVFGRARLVEDAAERDAALAALVEHVVPGRNADCREPNETELKQTKVLKLSLTESSAKIRTGAPGDEDEDYALPHWAGVIPLSITAHAPEADPKLPADIPLPDYLQNYSR